jgi:hypothetical protein
MELLLRLSPAACHLQIPSSALSSKHVLFSPHNVTDQVSNPYRSALNYSAFSYDTAAAVPAVCHLQISSSALSPKHVLFSSHNLTGQVSNRYRSALNYNSAFSYETAAAVPAVCVLILIVVPAGWHCKVLHIVIGS